jgi:cell shape-determining protein MreD
MKIEKNDNVSIGFGIASYLMAFFSDYWYSVWYSVVGNTENNTVNVFVPPLIPVLLWIVCFLFLGFFREKSRKCYLWLFLSAPFCFKNIVETLMTFLAWSISGFAP